MPWSGDVFSGQDVLANPNAPLVGPDDFAEWYGIVSPTNDQLNRIQTACEIASAQIRNGRRIFSPVTNETVLVDAHGGQALLLPKNRLPITAVTTVEQLSGADYVTVDSTEYDWSADGFVVRPWACWTDRPAGVRVTYSHGYDILPREVAGVCLSLAKRLYDNPDGTSVQSEQLGDHHVTYQGGASGSLSSDESLLLSQYESRA